MNRHAKIDIRHSTCPHDCPSACALDVEVIEGRSIGRVRGSKLQTYTAGVVCAKVARYAERIHHPERLMYPLRRTGPKGSGSVRADLVGRGARRDRRAFRFCRARVRRGIGLALLLRRHDGPRDARRHQPPRSCEEIFALLSDDLREHCARRVCDRHRQDRRRRSARDGRLRPRRDLGHQSRQHPGQCDDACLARQEGARRADRGGRCLQQRHDEAGRHQDHPAAGHRRCVRLRRDACAVPRRLCRSHLYGPLHRLPG